MQIPDVVATRFDILVYDIWRNGSDFDETVVLDEDCVTGQIAMDDWRVARLVQVTKIVQSFITYNSKFV